MPSLPSTPKALCQPLYHAQQKLMRSEVPLQLSAIAYVRICCQSMNQTRQRHQAMTPPLYTSWGPHSYLELLGQLNEIEPAWWTNCYVNQGCLESHNIQIQQLLQPLNHFAQSCNIGISPSPQRDAA